MRILVVDLSAMFSTSRNVLNPFSLWGQLLEGFDFQAVESKLVYQQAEWANKPALQWPLA